MLLHPIQPHQFERYFWQNMSVCHVTFHANVPNLGLVVWMLTEVAATNLRLATRGRITLCDRFFSRLLGLICRVRFIRTSSIDYSGHSTMSLLAAAAVQKK